VELPLTIIHPRHPKKVLWDIFIAACIMYSTISVPFWIGFSVEATGFWMGLDVVVDICFGIDMMLSFRTAYENSEGELVSAAGDVALNYLKGWFTIDFVSTVPIDRIATLTGTHSACVLNLFLLLFVFECGVFGALLFLLLLFVVVQCSAVVVIVAAAVVTIVVVAIDTTFDRGDVISVVDVVEQVSVRVSEQAFVHNLNQCQNSQTDQRVPNSTR